MAAVEERTVWITWEPESAAAVWEKGAQNFLKKFGK